MKATHLLALAAVAGVVYVAWAYKWPQPFWAWLYHAGDSSPAAAPRAVEIRF